MLSLIHNEIVVQHTWMSNAEFSNILAISQMTPGPIAINSATYIGYNVAGFWGSFLSTLAVCLPALTLMIILTKFFLKLKNNTYFEGIINGTKPIVIGLIAAAALLFIFPIDNGTSCFSDIWSWIIFAICITGLYFKSNPFILLLISGALGLLIYS